MCSILIELIEFVWNLHKTKFAINSKQMQVISLKFKVLFYIHFIINKLRDKENNN